MSKNLILPSGNNLIVTGGNLVLSPEIITIVSTSYGMYSIDPLVVRAKGSFHVYNTFLPKAKNSFRIKTSIINTVYGSFNITPTAMSARGYSIIRNTFQIKEKGVTRIRGNSVLTQRGYARVWNSFNLRGTGSYNIKVSFLNEEKGLYNVHQSFQDSKMGRIRIENTGIEGYVVYVGHDSMPDFSSIPVFSATLPISIDITPPSVAEEIYIVVRKRNRYGLVSQNQKPYILKIEPTGEENLGGVTAPENTTINPVENECFIVHATYSGLYTDTHPATGWNIYFKKDSAPVVGVDTPVATGDISEKMAVNIGPYTEGGATYYLIVSVFRDDDDEEVAGDTVEFTLQDDPLTPVSVGGGFEEV